tara:strand:+ start:1399 stop:1593 length:195 start_codon:yes stop_codon:yes gene_type:complete
MRPASIGRNVSCAKDVVGFTFTSLFTAYFLAPLAVAFANPLATANESPCFVHKDFVGSPFSTEL